MKNVLVFVITLYSSFAAAFEIAAKQAILMDYDTRTIIYEKDAYKQIPPASMSKMMTAYAVFNEIKNGKLKLDQEVAISEHAWRKQGSKTYIGIGTQVKVEDLLKGMIVQSGNDAAIALAESIAGSEEVFAEKLNQLGAKIGLKHSHFTNSTGWPDPNHYSNCYDLAVIASETIKTFPEFYNLYAEREFVYNKIRQPNRNKLLKRNIGCDGLKTGHTEEAGYNITVSAVRDNRRLVGVVSGLDTDKERNLAAETLLKYGFMNFSNVLFAKPGDVLGEAKVKYGLQNSIKIVAKENLLVTLPNDEVSAIKAKVLYNKIIRAPITTDMQIGELLVSNSKGEEIKRLPLYPSEKIDEKGFMGKIKDALFAFML